MKKIAIIITLSTAYFTLGFGQTVADFNIDTVSIASNILSEDRTILIFKPNGFANNDPASIIYLLDGEYAKSRFERIANEENKQIIGIGIINTDRRRDLLPANQADKFLNFIEKELIQSIESNYKIRERILFGHSFGGAFTIYSMINKPSLFNKYIASSPTPIMSYVNANIYKELENTLQKNIKFYFSYGSKDMRQVKKWALRLNNNLIALETHRFNWKCEVYDGKNHTTSDKMAIVKGTKF